MCKCDRSNWRVIVYKHHHTRTNGTTQIKPIRSTRSCVYCSACDARWETTAKYVQTLRGPRHCICFDIHKHVNRVSV